MSVPDRAQWFAPYLLHRQSTQGPLGVCLARRGGYLVEAVDGLCLAAFTRPSSAISGAAMACAKQPSRVPPLLHAIRVIVSQPNDNTTVHRSHHTQWCS
eukprot:1160350-Pelagomonas_calceolata.AAC.6